MKTAILSIGTEILFGETINTNVLYLTRAIHGTGNEVIYHITVGDNNERIHRALDTVFKDCDAVIATGGLGPTGDDITRTSFAEYFDLPLKRDEKTENDICEFLNSRKIQPTSNNMKQALIPSGATIFYNGVGTAPGFMIEKDGKILISLPGPPAEMRGMFENSLSPVLCKFSKGRVVTRTIRTLGIAESNLESKILDLVEGQKDPTIGIYAKKGECTIRLASMHENEEDSIKALNDLSDRIKERLSGYVTIEGDVPLPEYVIELLINKGITVSSAESCTGGNFAGLFTSVAGASKVFNRGFVTYSNEAKVEDLGVDAETIKRYGAVSTQVCKEMAEAVYAKTRSDVCVSVTGVAGPDFCKKPPGLIYIGVHYKGNTEVFELNTHSAKRNVNRRAAVLHMYKYIYEIACKGICGTGND